MINLKKTKSGIMTTGRYEQMLIAIQHKGYIDAQEARELMHHQDLVKQSTLETIECGACGHRDVYIHPSSDRVRCIECDEFNWTEMGLMIAMVSP